MAALTIQVIAEAGITPSYAAVTAGGDTAANANGDIFLHFKNTNAASRTVTVTAQVASISNPSMGTTTKANVSVVVPATTGDKMIGPFPVQAFNDASNNILITYSADAGLTVAAVQFKKPS